MGIEEMADAELLARRLELDDMRQACNRDLALLNREYERRERANHQQQQNQARNAEAAAVASAIGTGVTASA